MPPSATAQIRDIPVEVFAGNRAFAHQMYLTKYTDSTSQFGYFGYLRYETPYSDRLKSSFLGQSIFIYDVAKGVSLGGGGYITGAGFTPQLAVAYGRNIGDVRKTLPVSPHHLLLFLANGPVFPFYGFDGYFSLFVFRLELGRDSLVTRLLGGNRYCFFCWFQKQSIL